MLKIDTQLQMKHGLVLVTALVRQCSDGIYLQKSSDDKLVLNGRMSWYYITHIEYRALKVVQKQGSLQTYSTAAFSATSSWPKSNSVFYILTVYQPYFSVSPLNYSEITL